MFSPKQLKSISLAGIKFALVALILVLISGLLSNSLASSYTSKDIISEVNHERVVRHLKPLIENEQLSKASLAKAKDMLAENKFEHFYNGKTPWQFISAEGYNYKYAGENLAMDFDRSDAIMRAWMASPAHRDNILNKRYTDIGIGVVDGVLEGHQTTLVVQMFGREKGSILGVHTNPIIKFFARLFGL